MTLPLIRLEVGPGRPGRAEIVGDPLELKAWIDRCPEELEASVAAALHEALTLAFSPNGGRHG